MTVTSEHRGGDKPRREFLNPARHVGRYRLLDRNSDPESSRPSLFDEAPVNRLRVPHCQKGT
ncbi:hypothetical protein [Micromonospora sp. WMMC250]|uniref:hypothetical protein n=1 Tax=Micromonospora sp. WMMC250 TaxID=3014781 RepID=UPI0022B6CC52|nr:hypothetical protein [Micromonospora sp. WMMC250]MCZ7373275.1 hypothetical protein [Micromonospora sp. WMMC250]MCZ7373314.1 hypothetical protein [Micromonospora sp. WMMC250]MCZ7379925.1 hypothetical protein [Micromonospora sp. WMMC250]